MNKKAACKGGFFYGWSAFGRFPRSSGRAIHLYRAGIIREAGIRFCP